MLVHTILALGIIAICYVFAFAIGKAHRRRIQEKQFNADMLKVVDKAKPGDVWFVPYDDGTP
jgi:hypothetical protein